MLLPYFYLTILVDCKDNINLYFTKNVAFATLFLPVMHISSISAGKTPRQFMENSRQPRRGSVEYREISIPPVNAITLHAG